MKKNKSGLILFLSFCCYLVCIAESTIDFHIYQTSREGDRLKRVERKSLDNNDSSHSLKVDPSRTYQTIVGVGSSFTESAAAVWSELSKSNNSY